MIGYEKATPEMLDFLARLFKTQGKTSNNCTGMSSFTFIPERLTFYASTDELVPWYKHPESIDNRSWQRY